MTLLKPVFIMCTFLKLINDPKSKDTCACRCPLIITLFLTSLHNSSTITLSDVFRNTLYKTSMRTLIMKYRKRGSSWRTTALPLPLYSKPTRHRLTFIANTTHTSPLLLAVPAVQTLIARKPFLGICLLS